jgi:hypothetical protein
MSGSGVPTEKPLLSTGLTVPIGHTVVLGSVGEKSPLRARGIREPDGAAQQPSADRALILTLTPQFTPPRKDDQLEN